MNNEVLDNELFAPVQSDMQNSRFAGFWVRAAASIIDSLIFIPVILISFQNIFHWKILAVEILITFSWMFYKVFMEYRYQGTWGKQLLKLKVVNESGGGITFEQSLVRFSFYFMSYMGALMSNYYMFSDAGFQAVHTLNDLAIWEEGQDDTISILASIPLMVSVSLVAFDLRKQAIHDKMAKTYCVYKANN